MVHRRIKKTVARLLQAETFDDSLATLCALPARQVVNPLFGLLYSGDPMVRWRAVTAMGVVVSRLADSAIESARIIMRRFMWNLNDESGGIGWGSPESMADIMSRHRRLAREYAPILVSYADPQGNYLEHPGLQEGVMWALGRLGRVHADLVRPAGPLLSPYISSGTPQLSGLALWAAAALQDRSLDEVVSPLARANDQVTIYIDDRLETYTLGQLAQDAMGLDRSTQK